jgi:hypothetical protein
MLLATNFDVPFVQSQVGHTDSKLTMDVYTQLLDRSKRAHGEAFDALLADAQETLYGAQSGEFSPLFSPPSDFGPSADISPSSEIGSDTGETDDGRGGFRREQLSNVVDEGVKDHQAAILSFVVVVSSSVTFVPSLNVAPSSTSPSSSAPLKARHRSWAASRSL